MTYLSALIWCRFAHFLPFLGLQESRSDRRELLSALSEKLEGRDEYEFWEQIFYTHIALLADLATSLLSAD